MMKIIALLLVHLSAAMVYYDCNDRVYCSLYRKHLVWGANSWVWGNNATKFDFSYAVDAHSINEQ